MKKDTSNTSDNEARVAQERELRAVKQILERALQDVENELNASQTGGTASVPSSHEAVETARREVEDEQRAADVAAAAATEVLSVVARNSDGVEAAGVGVRGTSAKEPLRGGAQGSPREAWRRRNSSSNASGNSSGNSSAKSSGARSVQSRGNSTGVRSTVVSDEPAVSVALPTTSAATSPEDMPTVAIPLGSVSRPEEHAKRPHAPLRVRDDTVFESGKRLVRHGITGLFGVWMKLSTTLAKYLHWYPCVKPYVGYGTEEYSRLICRTLYAPRNAPIDRPERGLREMMQVAAPHERVYIDIDGTPLKTVQIGEMEIYDPVDPAKSRTSDYAVSDSCGYLDLLAEHHLAPGTHTFTVAVPRRSPVDSELFIIPDDCPVGIISDIDDTIMVTQVPTVWKAAYNLLLTNPHRRASVPGMSVLYNKIRDMFPQSPFFYLSTSPWNVEQQVRGFIRDYGFPDGPMLLRDLDPRPKRFVPSGVNHKLEYAEQLMEDFPNMKFILFGDDGQKDPTTYATIAHRYPGRVLAIGIRQLSAREASGGFVGSMSGMALSQPMPDIDVPVFTGNTGTMLMKTMLPYLQQFQKK